MMITFSKLNWKQFQDMCADLLVKEGFEIIRRSGIGSDRGMDILIRKKIKYGPRSWKVFIWLVQCKYKNKSKISLKPKELGDFISDLSRHNANGYWIITNTYLSTSLEDKISSLNNDQSIPYQATYWDVRDLENNLLKHRFIMEKYFSEEKETTKKEIKLDKINPYKELQSYDEKDMLYFFGRENEIKEVLSRIYKFSVVGLFGESGVGKTSLLKAGLIPNLRREKFWIVYIRCLDEPIKRIREKTLKILLDKKVIDESINKIGSTTNISKFLIELRSLLDKNDQKMIILIDQFEELFTRANENERKQLAEGMIELLSTVCRRGKLSLLLAIREDYIGELWDWAHIHNIQEAWINTFRIRRFNDEKAIVSISKPINKIGIEINNEYLNIIVSDLRKIGDGLIYPPYLQIVCYALFEEHRRIFKKEFTKLDKKIYLNLDRAEGIIIRFFDETLLEGLNEEEKYLAQNILDTLTGGEGLRTVLSINEISKIIGADYDKLKHIMDHLIKKRLIHTIVKNDIVVGYELVHDFLSKTFFEKLSPEAKRIKTTIDIFRKAFKEYKQYGILASKDRLEIISKDIDKFSFNEEEYHFLLKSQFNLFWSYHEMWIKKINTKLVYKICTDLFDDDNITIVNNAIRCLVENCGRSATPILQDVITDEKKPSDVRSTAIDQFNYNIKDERIIPTLKEIIEKNKNTRFLRVALKSLVHNLSNLDEDIIKANISVLINSLDNRSWEIRVEAAYGLGIVKDRSVINILLKKYQNEISYKVKKNIIQSLGNYINGSKIDDKIISFIEDIYNNENEDFRTRQEAKNFLAKYKRTTI